ncbi:MAG: CRISPR-associated endonuclease Cas1, partial [Thainema sp.]
PPYDLILRSLWLFFEVPLSLIRLEGLNPYLGNLHRSERHEPHLVCDLVEEFRSPIADTLMLALVNQRMLKPDDFTEPNEQGGVYLRDRSRRLFIQAFEKRMSTELTHPDAAKPVTYRRAIQLQIRCYKRCLLEDVPYEPFRRVT